MESNFYCVTWGTSQRLLPKECNPSINLTNNSLRQIFKISLGGNKFRIKLSNYYGKQNLEIKSISIAKTFPLELNKININTIHFFTFNKKEEIIIKKGEEIYFDKYYFKGLFKNNNKIEGKLIRNEWDYYEGEIFKNSSTTNNSINKNNGSLINLSKNFRIELNCNTNYSSKINEIEW